jgi:hypothetical protein
MKFAKIGSDGRPLGQPVLAAFLDEKTGLMWPTEDVSKKELNHKDALAACAAYRALGFNDWRLPTRAELETLIDLSRFDPAADPELGLKSAYYWSSTPLASSPGDYAWGVYFSSGHASYYLQDSTAFVRPVRSARASQ